MTMSRADQIEASYDGAIPKHLRAEIVRLRQEPVDRVTQYLGLISWHRNEAIHCAERVKALIGNSKSYGSAMTWKARLTYHRKTRLGLIAAIERLTAESIKQAAE